MPPPARDSPDLEHPLKPPLSLRRFFSFIPAGLLPFRSDAFPFLCSLKDPLRVPFTPRPSLLIGQRCFSRPPAPSSLESTVDSSGRFVITTIYRNPQVTAPNLSRITTWNDQLYLYLFPCLFTDVCFSHVFILCVCFPCLFFFLLLSSFILHSECSLGPFNTPVLFFLPPRFAFSSFCRFLLVSVLVSVVSRCSYTYSIVFRSKFLRAGPPAQRSLVAPSFPPLQGIVRAVLPLPCYDLRSFLGGGEAARCFVPVSVISCTFPPSRSHIPTSCNPSSFFLPPFWSPNRSNPYEGGTLLRLCTNSFALFCPRIRFFISFPGIWLFVPHLELQSPPFAPTRMSAAFLPFSTSPPFPSPLFLETFGDTFRVYSAASFPHCPRQLVKQARCLLEHPF